MGQSATDCATRSSDTRKVHEVFRRIVDSGTTTVPAVEYSNFIDWFVQQDGLGMIDRRVVEAYFDLLRPFDVVVCHSGYNYYSIVGRRLEAFRIEE